MMGYNNFSGGAGFGMGGVLGAGLGFLLLPLMLWSIAWKGYALWKAAKNNNMVWFIVLLVVNTLGILDILYIYVFGNKSESKVKQVKVVSKKSKKK